MKHSSTFHWKGFSTQNNLHSDDEKTNPHKMQEYQYCDWQIWWWEPAHLRGFHYYVLFLSYPKPLFIYFSNKFANIYWLNVNIFYYIQYFKHYFTTLSQNTNRMQYFTSFPYFSFPESKASRILSNSTAQTLISRYSCSSFPSNPSAIYSDKFCA